MSKADALPISQKSEDTPVPTSINQFTTPDVPKLYKLYIPPAGHVKLEIVFFRESQMRNDAYFRDGMMRDVTTFWLERWLSDSFPQSHIYSVSYDSTVITFSSGGLIQMKNLLNQLTNLLIEEQNIGQSCPVLFVGDDESRFVLYQFCVEAHLRSQDFPVRIKYKRFMKYMKCFLFYPRVDLPQVSQIRGEVRDRGVLHYNQESQTGKFASHRKFTSVIEDFSVLCDEFKWRHFFLREDSRFKLLKESASTPRICADIRRVAGDDQQEKNEPSSFQYLLRFLQTLLTEEVSSEGDENEISTKHGELPEAKRADLERFLDRKQKSMATKKLLGAVKATSIPKTTDDISRIPLHMRQNSIFLQKDEASHSAYIHQEAQSISVDVRGLGFHNFDESFDAKRILSICTETDDQDAVELTFFHKEGMAAIFGVGISFSKVTITRNGEIEITELEELDWFQLWNMVESKNLVLFHDQFSESMASPSNSFTAVPLSNKDGAEWYGVGVPGMARFELPTQFQRSQECHGSSRKIISSQEWMISLFDLLKAKPNTTTSDSLGFTGDPKSCESDVRMTEASGGITGSSRSAIQISDHGKLPSHMEMFSACSSDSLANRSNLAESADSHVEKPIKSDKLMVIIRWITKGLKFFSHDDESNELILQTHPNFPKFFDKKSGRFFFCSNQNIFDCKVSPVVTVTFFLDGDQVAVDQVAGGDGTKKFNTVLSASFHNIPSSLDESFGWHHDNLRLSLRCMEDDAVFRDVNDLDDEVMSKHEIRNNGGVRGNEIANSSTGTGGLELNISGGMPGLVSGGIGLTGSLGRGTSTKAWQGFSTQVSVMCLRESNFRIDREERISELGYVASLFPSFFSYDLYSCGGRDIARRSGMMSTIPIKIQGNWSVLEEENNIIPRFCEYKFLCQRDLISSHLILSQKITDVKKLKSLTSKRHLTSTLCESIKQEKIKQRLERVLTMNHSFTHMRRLRKPEAYLWNIKGDYDAPSSVRKIIY